MNTLLIISLAALLSSYCSGDINAEPSAIPSRKLTISELDYYVNTDEGRTILQDEFKTIKGGQRRPWTVAELPENLKKNRYDDLLAFDETRVVLETLPDDPSSDYINANYIDGSVSRYNQTNAIMNILTGQNKEKEYVATQGPLPNTINDFWRMIWQLNSTKIIMLANIIEHGKTKVEKYWPETVDVYGDITVAKLSQYEIPKIQHVVRTFSVKKEGISTPRIVRHFHFTGWPDLGVPSDRMSVVSIILQARKYRPDSKAPMVVHCSAGVGRTGTIILTDSMLQKAIAEGEVDFPKRLDSMRMQRVDVVEKEAQYVFAHQALNDYFNGNGTEEYLRKVEAEYKQIDSQSYSDVPNDFSGILRKMKWHNSGIRILVEALESMSTDEEDTDSISL